MNSHHCRNPSERRQGLAIAFSCEDCDAKLELTIAQHKGNTIVEWRLQPEKHGWGADFQN
jgi:hypothetical protein